jgi:nicotinate-nucleotide adenylyltransferase
MIEFAIAGYPLFRVSTMELDRPGPHYTVDTLRSLKESHPADELFLLIGGDSLAEFATWRSPEEICRLATVVAVNRGRATLDASGVASKLGAEIANRIQKVPMPAIDLSASDIRRRIAAGQSIRFQTPRPVEQYILQHQLYRNATKPGAGA